jgi:NAD(P)H-hydrate epimerase
MAAVDRRVTEELGLPGLVLMENAALGVVEAIENETPTATSAAVYCGPGNNGGDGLAVARHLAVRGWRVEIFLLTSGRPSRGDAGVQLEVVRRLGLPVRAVGDETTPTAAALAAADGFEVVVDALFGTGLSRPLSGPAAQLVEGLSGVRGLRVAVDLPSGLMGSRWEIPGPCFTADLTVTFGAPKLAHALLPASGLMGRIAVADLGVPPRFFEQAEGDLRLLTAAELSLQVAARGPDSHKGTHGHLLIVAGSTGKSGAAVLAARGALRCGAGLVSVAVPASIQAQVAVGCVEAMTLGLSHGAAGELATESVEEILAACRERDAAALGPGLGRSEPAAAALREVVLRLPVPLVLDADGLLAFAGRLEELAARPAATVLTPHPGEMAVMLGCTVADVQTDRPAAVRRAVEASRCHLILKGARSLVAGPHEGIAINPTGNPGMGTGGTGDVLTGMVGALLAAGRAPFDAGCLATFLHGLAGDRAAAAGDETSLTAGDVVEALPVALRELRGA